MSVARREARCCCGALRAVAVGDPAAVVICHCTECQRRTGSVMGVSAYYPRESVKTSGPAASFTRPGQSGGGFTQHFCPTCGTSLYWEAELRPGLIGIAVGAFVDSSFPAPTRSVWEEHKHRWVELGAEIPGHIQGSASAKTR